MEGFEAWTKLSPKAELKLEAVREILEERTSSDFRVISSSLESKFELSGAEIRQIIRRLRFDGVPIGSSAKGYFWARKGEELDSTIAHITARIEALEILRRSLTKSRIELFQCEADWSSEQEELF